MIVARGFDLAAGHFLGVLQVAVVQVRRDDGAHAGHRLEVLQQVRAADADADESQADLVVFRGCLELRTRARQFIDDRPGAGALQKIPSRSVHGRPKSNYTPKPRRVRSQGYPGGQPVLNRLKSKTEKQEHDPEDAQTPLREAVGKILDYKD